MKMMRFSYGLLGVCSLIVLSVSVALADLPPQWVWSTFPAKPPTEKSVLITETFNYTETVFKANGAITVVAKNQKHNDDPETAFISRMSAIVAGDYEWWLETWDEVSRQVVIERNQAKGYDKNYWLKQWQEQFSNRKITPIRKIVSGPDYVIITYKIFTEDGKEASSGFELPSILKRIDGKWYSTLDLKADALLIASPWVSGKDELFSIIF